MRARRWLWVTILVSSAWLFLVFAPFYVLGPVVADRDLGGAGAWATILAAYGLGGVAGGTLALRWSPRRPLFTAALLFLLEAPAPALLALGAPVWLIAASAALGGASFGVFSALWDTTMQRRVPAAALSRVSSFDWMGSLALLPAGYALAGPAGAALGVDPVLIFAACVAVALPLGHGRRPGHPRAHGGPNPVSGSSPRSHTSASSPAAARRSRPLPSSVPTRAQARPAAPNLAPSAPGSPTRRKP